MAGEKMIEDRDRRQIYSNKEELIKHDLRITELEKDYSVMERELAEVMKIVDKQSVTAGVMLKIVKVVVVPVALILINVMVDNLIRLF